MQRKHKIPFVLPVLSDRLEPVVTIAMPRNNAFAHQRYSPEKPTTIWHLVQPSEPSVAGSVEYQQQMASVGQAYRTAGVRAIWLIHGTFAGDDALGLVRVWERIAPGMGRRLRQLNKTSVVVQVFVFHAYDDKGCRWDFPADVVLRHHP